MNHEAPIAQGPVDVNVRLRIDKGATCKMCGNYTNNQDGTQDGGCLKCVQREWYLQSDAQRKGWGPFKSEDDAWRYLFGRDFTMEERKLYEEADWAVGYINKWPNGPHEGPARASCAGPIDAVVGHRR